MILKKKWFAGITASILAFSVFAGPVLGKQSGKDTFEWAETPYSKPIVDTNDHLLYGILKKGSSYIAGVGRQYKGKETVIMTSAYEKNSRITESSLFYGYESKKSKSGPYEMGVAFGFKKVKDKMVPVSLPILDTTPKSGSSEVRHVTELPLKPILSAVQKEGKAKKQSLKVSNSKKESEAVFQIDGKSVASLEDKTNFRFVAAWWSETGIGDDHLNAKNKNKDYISHNRPYALAYRTIQKNGQEKRKWEVYTPSYGKNSASKLLNDLIVAHTFEIDGELARYFDQAYLGIKEENLSALTLQGSFVNNIELKEFGYKLTWNNPGKSTAYKVYRKDNVTNVFTVIKEIVNPEETSFLDSSLETGKTYTYKVTYMVDSKESLDSNSLLFDQEISNDTDQLSDFIEAIIGSDPEKADTDEDGLADDYEYNVSHTSPVKKDTDENGLNDGDEDYDGDGLTTMEEKGLHSNPIANDTDSDGLLDNDELQVGTKVDNPDTDDDNLEDGEEAALGFDPTKKDTDADGIIDSLENNDYKVEVDEAEKSDKIQPSVSIQTTAENAATVMVTNMEGTDSFLNENIPGYIGAPYDFHSENSFSEAIITFKYDESVVKEGFQPEIYYYNETEKRLDRLETLEHDTENNTVSAKVTHFSTYILLNSEEFDKIWETEIRPPELGNDGKVKNIDMVLSIDSSGSMAWEDPEELRKVAAKAFVDKLKEEDRGAVVDFDSWGNTTVHLTTDKEAIKYGIDMINSSGGTDLYQGVNTAVDELISNSNPENLKFIIFMTDGDGYWHDSVLEKAIQNGITIYTIGLGSGVRSELLTRIAETTGGKYYFASSAEQLEDIFDEAAGDTIDYVKDTDEDTIPDYYEKNGMRLGNGELVFPDYLEKDTDGDGLYDNEEVTMTYIPHNGGYFISKSDPTLEDSDVDGIHDAQEKEAERMIPNFTQYQSIVASELSYYNLKKYKNEKVENIPIDFANEGLFMHKKADPTMALKGWKLIKSNNSYAIDLDGGFGAIALKKGNNIVIAFRGTDGAALKDGIFEIENIGDVMPLDLLRDDINWNSTNDWIGNASIFLTNIQPQLNPAGQFTAEIIKDYPNANLYISGHSLGGYLTQVISYQIENHSIKDHLFYKNEDKVEKVLNNNPDYLVKATTYNAAFQFTFPGSLIGYFTRVIDLDDLFSSKYDQLIYNYAISGDLLTEAMDKSASRRLGFMHTFDKPNPLSISGAHGVDNFYQYIPEMYQYEKH